VVDESAVQTIPEKAPLRAPIVKAEWFWVSVQNEGCADEKDYLFEDVSHFIHYFVYETLKHLEGASS
jgi:hypothetical protein